MEFSELRKELGGLTAEQVFNVAKYGMDILNIAGIGLLSEGLVALASKVLMSDEIDKDEYSDAIANMLQIAQRTNELNEQCMYEGKTPLGLVGVDFDNNRFNFGKAKKLSELKNIA